MPKSDVDEVTDKTIEKGGLLTRMYFDMQSEKQADLQPLMTDLINNRLLKMNGVVYCFGSIEEPIKTGEVYSTSAAVTVLLKDVGSLINVAFNMAPAGLEILRPERDYKLKINELQSILLDVAQISANYSQYILSRVLSKEDYEKVMRDMKNREELGKKLLAGREDEKDQHK